MSFIAHCCLKTKLLSEFALSAMCWTLTNRIPSSLIILQASCSFITSLSASASPVWSSSIFLITILHESIKTSLLSSSFTTYSILSRLLSFMSYLLKISLINYGFFYAIETNFPTLTADTLNSLAISWCFLSLTNA